MWDAGLAHRDVKPANLLVRDGRLLLIDVSFAEVRPTPWWEAVDLANMMMCLALRTTADRVYQHALRLFTVEEISEAFAADRSLTLPSQLRQALRDSGRDVHEEFLRLLSRRPVPVRCSAGARGGDVGRSHPGHRPGGPWPARAPRPQRDPDHHPAR
jgi:serine/threonine protein kinase